MYCKKSPDIFKPDKPSLLKFNKKLLDISPSINNFYNNL